MGRALSVKSVKDMATVLYGATKTKAGQNPRKTAAILALLAAAGAAGGRHLYKKRRARLASKK
jgi:hypothetical protein